MKYDINRAKSSVRTHREHHGGRKNTINHASSLQGGRARVRVQEGLLSCRPLWKELLAFGYWRLLKKLVSMMMRWKNLTKNGVERPKMAPSSCSRGGCSSPNHPIFSLLESQHFPPTTLKFIEPDSANCESGLCRTDGHTDARTDTAGFSGRTLL